MPQTTTRAQDEMIAALTAQRERTLDLVSHLSDADLERQTDPIMSPLVWDLGHVAAYEDLWLGHRFAGHELLHAELADVYDAFETPRAVRGDIEILDRPGATAYLERVRERTIADIERRGVDPVLHELVLRHEMQHTETMRQAMTLAGMLPDGEPALRPCAVGPPWLLVSGGGVWIGAADADGFSYDNERPRHRRVVRPFQIMRYPVTNASWLTFTEGGGYVRREWWSDEGWAWKEEYDITHPLTWTAHGRPSRPLEEPVVHVSWFEADAFARFSDARLPTEAEWETAATWDQETTRDTGLVWEWTQSHFTGYPGFVAHPYREYSEVFFGDRHRVLRGGSWATQKRVVTPTFRNWDLPQRRQIFSGLRLARDV
jgi:gamma-glutamyl hercynylcysteine S-oxide synthase